jgi:hypothetical protein
LSADADLLGRGRRVLHLRAQLNEPEQHFVSLRRERVDGARADLGVNAVGELLLHLGRQHRLSENLPPGRYWSGKLLEEVLDAALTAAKMVEKQATHDAPTQAGAP